MRTVTLMKSILVIAIISTAMVFSSCKKNTKPGGKKAVEIEIPCKDEGRSDKNFFRADANATSQDMSLSREKALLADRKSTRLNSSHVRISYAVFCLKKKKKKTIYRSI